MRVALLAVIAASSCADAEWHRPTDLYEPATLTWKAVPVDAAAILPETKILVWCWLGLETQTHGQVVVPRRESSHSACNWPIGQSLTLTFWEDPFTVVDVREVKTKDGGAP